MILCRLFTKPSLALCLVFFQSVHCGQQKPQTSVPASPALIGRLVSADCAKPEIDETGKNETATVSYIANDRGVPYYLNNILVNVIKPKYGNLGEYKKLCKAS